MLKLRMATIPYDRVNALRTREVVPKDIELDYVTSMPGHDIFLRMVEGREFDVSEMSLGLHCVQRTRGEFPFVALPVYLSRMFRHSNVYLARSSGIQHPKDLEGRRVGIQEFRQSTLIWVRGILRDEYGVDTRTIQWIEGGVNKPRSPSATDVRPANGAASIKPLEQHATLSEALAAGGIDAAICARRPASFDTSDNVVRMFPEYRLTELEYFKRTGIFPIMHIVVIREDLFEESPWVAQSMFDALALAKHDAWRRLHFGALAFMSPWLHDDIAEVKKVFGGNPFRYGLESSRIALETFIRYLVEDEMIESHPTIESLFVSVDEVSDSAATEAHYW